MNGRPIGLSMTVLAFAMAISQAQAAGGPGGGAGGSRAGGMSGDHMSAGGRDNSNARHRSDSIQGLERAQERMSEQGKAHQKATEQEKKQGKTKSHDKKAATPDNGKKN